jgi:predicted aspartyl protease
MLKSILGVVVPLAIGAAVFAGNVADRVETAPRAKPEPSTARPAVSATNNRPPARDDTSRRGCARGEEMRVHADRMGHFNVQAELDGRPIEMLVDTGATRVIIPSEDARRIGLRPDPSRRKWPWRSACGSGRSVSTTSTLSSCHKGPCRRRYLA